MEANLTVKFTNNPRAAFVFKNRMKTRYTIPIPNAGVQSEIIEGAKFYYSKDDNKHKIWAKGPLHAEIVVLVSSTASHLNEIDRYNVVNVSNCFSYIRQEVR